MPGDQQYVERLPHVCSKRVSENMRTTTLSVLIFVTVLTVSFVPEHCHAVPDGELMHHDDAGIRISPSENKSYDWVVLLC